MVADPKHGHLLQWLIREPAQDESFLLFALHDGGSVILSGSALSESPALYRLLLSMGELVEVLDKKELLDYLSNGGQRLN